MSLSFPFDHPGAAQRPHFFNHRIDENRPMKVINIGAGFTGLICCIRIPRRFKNIEFVCYEKNADVGGTWLENTYPGVACDIPSHAYQASFEPNTEWTQYYSSGGEIWKYLKNLAVKYDAMKYVKLNIKMLEGHWQENKKMWKVTLQNIVTGEIFYDEANVLIGCYGNLNRPLVADIKDRDTFKGDLIHPAKWDHNVDLTGKTVAVIGNGSSAIQIIPAIKDKVSKLDNYVRSTTWITSGFGGDLVPVDGVHETRAARGVNFTYTKADKVKFREDKDYYKKYERALRDALCCLHLITYKGSPLANSAQKSTTELMRSHSIKKPEIVEALLPSWTIGCRRLTPGIAYIEALCEEKMTMVREPIEKFDETGIWSVEGNHRKYDAIIVASGYDLSYKVCPMYGRNGVSLSDIYDDAPESYLGINPPEMPNYYVPSGPNGIVTTGSFLPVLEYVVTYIISCIDKMQRERIASMTPKTSAIKAYHKHCDAYFTETVYSESCKTWMRAAKNYPDRITAIYPGSYLHFRNVLSHPRWEDYDYEMDDVDDLFYFMGNGLTSDDVSMQGNFAPYMDLEAEFPELKEFWADEKLKANGVDGKNEENQVKGMSSTVTEIANGHMT